MVVGREQQERILAFTDLKAWQESHTLVMMVYQMLRELPSEERFGLIDQLRRASISITSNIAEGFSRKGSKEKIQFYYMSLGSLTEVQNQLILSRDVEYIDPESCAKILEQSVIAQKIINGLIRSIKAKQ